MQDKLMQSVGTVFSSQNHCFAKYKPTPWILFRQFCSTKFHKYNIDIILITESNKIAITKVFMMGNRLVMNLYTIQNDIVGHPLIT